MKSDLCFLILTPMEKSSTQALNNQVTTGARL